MKRFQRMLSPRLIKIAPSPDTVIAFTAGAGMIMLSLVLLLVNGISHAGPAHIILHDIIMVFLLGFCFPLYYIQLRQRHGLQCLGINRTGLKRSLQINFILAIFISLFFIIISPSLPQPNYNMLCATVYLLAMGCFEIIFFYGFMRYYIEKAFGIIPAIILTAAFYSLHHVGLQPEFIKFFLLGLMYTSFFYATRNIFVIFPFSWFAGAFWDTYLNGTIGLDAMGTLQLVIGLSLLVAMAVCAGYIHRQAGPKTSIKKFLTINAGSMQIPSKTRHFHNI